MMEKKDPSNYWKSQSFARSYLALNPGQDHRIGFTAESAESAEKTEEI
jgi:hypothetical protein